MTSYVGFEISDQKFIVDVSNVHEIVNYRKPNTVPHGAAYVEGMLDLRDSIITIIDPKIAMGIVCGKKASHIIVLRLGDLQVGISIDALGEMMTIDDCELYAFSDLFGNAFNPKVERMISCIAKDGDDIYRVIDTGHIKEMLT